jgi:hypothetical protein
MGDGEGSQQASRESIGDTTAMLVSPVKHENTNSDENRATEGAAEHFAMLRIESSSLRVHSIHLRTCRVTKLPLTTSFRSEYDRNRAQMRCQLMSSPYSALLNFTEIFEIIPNTEKFSALPDNTTRRVELAKILCNVKFYYVRLILSYMIITVQKEFRRFYYKLSQKIDPRGAFFISHTSATPAHISPY